MRDLIAYIKNRKNLTNLIIVLVLILGIPLGVELAQRTQIFKSRASGDFIEFSGEGVTSSFVNNRTSWFTSNKVVGLAFNSPFGGPNGTDPTPPPTTPPGLIAENYWQIFTPGSNANPDLPNYVNVRGGDRLAVDSPNLAQANPIWDQICRNSGYTNNLDKCKVDAMMQLLGFNSPTENVMIVMVGQRYWVMSPPGSETQPDVPGYTNVRGGTYIASSPPQLSQAHPIWDAICRNSGFSDSNIATCVPTAMMQLKGFNSSAENSAAFVIGGKYWVMFGPGSNANPDVPGTGVQNIRAGDRLAYTVSPNFAAGHPILDAMCRNSGFTDSNISSCIPSSMTNVRNFNQPSENSVVFMINGQGWTLFGPGSNNNPDVPGTGVQNIRAGDRLAFTVNPDLSHAHPIYDAMCRSIGFTDANIGSCTQTSISYLRGFNHPAENLVVSILGVKVAVGPSPTPGPGACTPRFQQACVDTTGNAGTQWCTPATCSDNAQVGCFTSQNGNTPGCKVIPDPTPPPSPTAFSCTSSITNSTKGDTTDLSNVTLTDMTKMTVTGANVPAGSNLFVKINSLGSNFPDVNLTSFSANQVWSYEFSGAEYGLPGQYTRAFYVKTSSGQVVNCGNTFTVSVIKPAGISASVAALNIAGFTNTSPVLTSPGVRTITINNNQPISFKGTIYAPSGISARSIVVLKVGNITGTAPFIIYPGWQQECIAGGGSATLVPNDPTTGHVYCFPTSQTQYSKDPANSWEVFLTSAWTPKLTGTYQVSIDNITTDGTRCTTSTAGQDGNNNPSCGPSDRLIVEVVNGTAALNTASSTKVLGASQTQNPINPIQGAIKGVGQFFNGLFTSAHKLNLNFIKPTIAQATSNPRGTLRLAQNDNRTITGAINSPFAPGAFLANIHADNGIKAYAMVIFKIDGSGIPVHPTVKKNSDGSSQFTDAIDCGANNVVIDFFDKGTQLIPDGTVGNPRYFQRSPDMAIYGYYPDKTFTGRYCYVQDDITSPANQAKDLNLVSRAWAPSQAGTYELVVNVIDGASSAPGVGKCSGVAQELGTPLPSPEIRCDNRTGLTKASPGNDFLTISVPSSTTTKFRWWWSKDGAAETTIFSPPHDAYKDYTSIPMVDTMTLDDTVSAGDIVWVYAEFIDKTGKSEIHKKSIIYTGGDPNITKVSCSQSPGDPKVTFSITGSNFGSTAGQISIGGNNLPYNGVWSNSPGDSNPLVIAIPGKEAAPMTNGGYDVIVKRADGKASAPKNCQLGQLKISLGPKFFCRFVNQHEIPDTAITLAEAIPNGGKVAEKDIITVGGTINLSTQLSSGQLYKISVKPPGGLRRTGYFTAPATNNSSGGIVDITPLPNRSSCNNPPADTAVTNQFVIPFGNIFEPTTSSDGLSRIDTFDYSYLKTQWGGKGDIKKADFNFDGKINSFEYACMRFDIGTCDDADVTPGIIPGLNPPPTAGPTVRPTESASATPNPPTGPICDPTSSTNTCPTGQICRAAAGEGDTGHCVPAPSASASPSQ